MRDFSDILDESAGQQARLLAEAFELGRAHGRREATNDLRQKLAGILSDETEAATQETAGPGDFFADDGFAGDGAATAEPASNRAPPGSVKPAIAKLVSEAPGLSREEIAARTGFKFNSVRGTLWSLEKENVVEQREGRFYPAAQKDEAAGTTSTPDTPTASITGPNVDDEGASDQMPTRGPEAAERQVVHDNMS